MIKLLFTFVFIVVAMFLFMALMGVGLLVNLFAKLTGGRRNSDADIAMLNSMAGLSPGEQMLLAEALQTGQQTIANLSDQNSIDALVSKQIVVQTADSSGIIDYRINDVAWKYLKSNRSFFVR